MKNTKLLLMFCAVSLVASTAKSMINETDEETSKALTILNSKPSQSQINSNYANASRTSRWLYAGSQSLHKLKNHPALRSSSKSTLLKDDKVKKELQELADKTFRSAIKDDKQTVIKEALEFMLEIGISLTPEDKALVNNYFGKKKEEIFAEETKELIAKGEALKVNLRWVQAGIKLTQPEAKEGEEAGYVSDPEDYTQTGKILKKLAIRTAKKLEEQEKAKKAQEEKK